MRFHCAILMMTLLLCLQANSQRKEVVGYYPSWKWKSRDNLVSPQRIPYDKLTIINYAFSYPLPDGSLAGRDSVGDNLYLRGEPGTTLIPLAHGHGVRVMLSIGGWEDSWNFPAVATRQETRCQFAHACLDQIRRLGFDGIDIDWEFPCFSGHNGTPADKRNFTLLLRTLRDSLSAEGLTAGRHYLLTAALPSSLPHAAAMEVDSIASILDQLNIMTYDFYGPWSERSGHNSPLFAPAGADTSLCVDASFRLYTGSYGVAAEKINLGVPFYGQTFTHCTALNSTHAGSDTTHFSSQGAFYYDIVASDGRFVRHWDEQARVPYLVSTAWDMLISYDDAESVRAKAAYVLAHHAHGLIIWEITGDYLADGTTPLLDAIDSAFRPQR